MKTSKPIFRELDADDADQQPTEIESMCMNCYKSGVTRLLLTKIPFYKDVVLMSFTCEECGYHNNEIQQGGAVAEKGVKITLKVNTLEDLNRQVVKSDYASVKIVEVNFEIPSQSQKGEVTTVEGLLNRSITGLEQDQEVRHAADPKLAEQIDKCIKDLQKLRQLESSFTLILDDISGNSFIENLNAPKVDNSCTTNYFVRNEEQNRTLGIYAQNEVKDGLLQPIQEGQFTLADMEGEILQFPTNCPNCNTPCETNMKMTKIPYFKEVLIMATVCEACGFKTNEVKSAGGIEAKGIHIEVDVNSKQDFSRDVLKSEMCNMQIPQLDLDVGSRALGGRFTTVEGLLVAMKEQLSDPNRCYMYGDSRNPETKARLEQFLRRIDDLLDGKLKVTVILDDPTGNSYIQSIVDGKLDDKLRITHYERSSAQNEELGLNDMRTEGYEES